MDSKPVEEEDVSTINKSLAESAKHRQGVCQLRPHAVTPSTDDLEDQDQVRHENKAQQEYRHLVEDGRALVYPDTPFGTVQYDFDTVEVETHQLPETTFTFEAYASPTSSWFYPALDLHDEPMETLFSETLQSTSGLTSAGLFGLPALL